MKLTNINMQMVTVNELDKWLNKYIPELYFLFYVLLEYRYIVIKCILFLQHDWGSSKFWIALVKFQMDPTKIFNKKMPVIVSVQCQREMIELD